MEFNCTLIRRKSCATLIVENYPENKEMIMRRLQEISFTVKISPDLSAFVMVIPLGSNLTILWNNLTWNCKHKIEQNYIQERTENHA
jgi:hypothetical protein